VNPVYLQTDAFCQALQIWLNSPKAPDLDWCDCGHHMLTHSGFTCSICECAKHKGYTRSIDFRGLQLAAIKLQNEISEKVPVASWDFEARLSMLLKKVTQ